METWKDIADYEGLYKVSSHGKVYSCITGKILNTRLSSSGYLKVQLYKNNQPKTVYIHRLVASSFLDKKSENLEVNHIDGNKTNNNIENLEWVTKSENQIHAIKNNLRKSSPMLGKTGRKNPKSKPVLQFSMQGKFLAEYACISEAARSVNCKHSSISACLSGRKKTAAGYVWKHKQADEHPIFIETGLLNSQGSRTWKQTNPRKSRKIAQVNLYGETVRVWDNYKQLSSETGYDSGNIYKVIAGKVKTAYGFIWKYAE